MSDARSGSSGGDAGGRVPDATTQDAQSFLQKRYDALIEQRQRLEEVRQGIGEQITAVAKELADIQAAGRIFGIQFPIDACDNQDKVSTAAFALAMLRDHYPKGIKAPQIRAAFLSERGIELHEKTMGMSLWRLKASGAIRREGHLWFSVPAPSAHHP
jgi:hypothetical protein